ncbi:MAG: terminase small subunit, Nu1, partial [Candidatus Binatia bacterium]
MPEQSAHVIAKLFNVTDRRVRQLAEQGIVPRPDRRGKYDLAACIRGYVKYLQECAFGAGTADLQAERGRLIRARADMAELELGERRAELIPAEELVRNLTWFVTAARSRLLALPRRIALRVDPKNPRELETAVDAEIRLILEELANDQSLPPWLADEKPGRAADRDDTT